MAGHCEEMECVNYADVKVVYDLTATSDHCKVPFEYVVTFCDVDGNEIKVHLKPELAYNIASWVFNTYVPKN